MTKQRLSLAFLALLCLEVAAYAGGTVITQPVGQQRVTGTCVGQVLVAINANGTVVCEADDTGGGSYTAGDGLTLIANDFDITHTSDFAITSDQLDLSTAVTAPGSLSVATLLDVDGDVSKFGAIDGSIYFNEDEINFHYGTAALATGYINFGSNFGTNNQFRNLGIGDGKGAQACLLTGSTKTLNCVGGLQVNGTNVATTSNISGTTGTVAKFTGANTVGNSAITDSGSGTVRVAKNASAALFQVGDDISQTTNSQSGWEVGAGLGDGNVYVDSKANTGGTTVFRSGAGAEAGSARTWLTVTNSNGTASFASRTGIGMAAPSADSLAVSGTMHVTDASTAYLRLGAGGSLNYIQSGSSLTSDSKRDLVFTSMSGATEWCRIISATGTLNCVGGLQVNGTNVNTFTTNNSIPKGNGSGLVASSITDNGTVAIDNTGGLAVSIGSIAKMTVANATTTIANNALIGDATTRSHTINGLVALNPSTGASDAALSIAGAVGYQLLVSSDTTATFNIWNASTSSLNLINTGGGLFALNVTGGTASAYAGSHTAQTISLGGSYDATAALRTVGGLNVSATGTRSTGSNSVYNQAFYTTASGGQINRAIVAGDGEVSLNTVSGNTCIGTTDCTTKLTVSGNALATGSVTFGDATTRSHTASGGFQLTETTGTTFAAVDGNASITVTDDTAFAQGVGGGILFQGKYTAGSPAGVAGIKAMKTNGTDGNYSFDLVLGTRKSGFSVAERLRLTDEGFARVYAVGQGGQLTSALTDAGSRAGLLGLYNDDTSAGAGGGIVFGNGQAIGAGAVGFAAIKGLLSNGANNTTGDLAFSTRAADTDTALTQRMHISGTTGLVSMFQGAAIGDAAGDASSLTGTLNANSTAGTNGQVLTIVSGVPQWATAASGGNVSTAGLTTNTIPKASGASVLVDSVLSESGGNLFSSGQVDVVSGSVRLSSASGGNIDFQYNTNALTEGRINYNGYLGGTTQFRDLGIYDGKNNRIALFSGTGGTANRQVKLDAQLDIDQDLTKFGSTDGTTYIGTNGLDCQYASNATATCYINAEGYNNGTTQNRNLYIQNGTGTASGSRVVEITGSTKTTVFYGPVQLGVGTTDAVTTAGDVAVAGAMTVTGGLNGYTQVTKASNQDVTNNATHQADTALTFATTATKAYAVEAFLIVSGSDATGDYAFRFGTTAGTLDGTGHCQSVTTADAIQHTILTAAAAATTGSTSVGTRANANIPIAVHCKFHFLQNTSAGNFRLEFANVSAAAGRISRTWAGSYIRYKQLN